MGILTDFFFGLGNMFLWLYEYTLVPIAEVADWLIFIIGAVMIIWWLSKLVYFGNDNEKDYEGW